MLYDERLLTLCNDGTHWEWNMTEILKQKATDNVVDFMVQRISQLSENTRNILKWISLLGNSVHLWKIEIILDIQRQDLLSALIPVIEAGMAHIVDDCFQFAHDRVQEAVHSKISQGEKKDMHYKIGTKLLFHADSIQDKFEVTDHLNKGVVDSETTDLSDEQLLQLLELNLTVGTRAHQAVAFTFANNYARCGIWCFLHMYKNEDSAWSRHYALGISLYMLLANSYFVLHEYDHMNEVIQLILAKSKNVADTTEVNNLLITYYNVIGDVHKALEVGRKAMELHGVIIPHDSDQIEQDLAIERQSIVKRMNELRRDDGEIDISSLLLPPTPEQFALLSLMATLGVTAYLAGSETFPLIMAKHVNHSFSHCVTSESSITFGFYACYLISREEYKDAHEFSKLSVNVAENCFPSKMNDRCKALHLYCVFARHWFKSIRQTARRSREVFKLAVGCGEIPYAGYSTTALCPSFLYTGRRISDSLKELDTCLEFATKTKNLTAIECVQAAAIALDLLSNDEERCQQPEAPVTEYNNAHYQVYMLMTDYILDDESYHDLNTHITNTFNKIERMQEVTNKLVKGHYAVVVFNVYSTLTIIRLILLLGETKHELSDDMNTFIDKNMKQLENWVNVCYKENFMNKYLLVSAELKSIRGDIWGAINLYDEAISYAKKNEFTHEHALANELAAKCMLRVGKPQFVKDYLNNAYESYEHWGATRKLDLLSEKYKGMISRLNYSGVSSPMPLGRHRHVTTLSSSLNTPLASLDIEGILRVSQTISSTINMSELLVKIMKVIVETAGATSAAIIIDNHVEAEYLQGSSQNITITSVPLQTWEHGCRAVIEYVTRTNENVVLQDAFNDKRYGFSNNPYIVRWKAKSILCMPVTHQNELKAVLYCENSKINDCFTVDRITVLSILTNQIAISLENSNYFKMQMKAVQDLAEIQSARAAEEKTYRKKQEEFVDRICHEIRNPIQGMINAYI
jgi:GAF domain-containing protein